MVESESFRKIIASFDGTAKPICTRALKNRISDYDIVICKLVVTMMEGCDVSLTLDHWTSKQHVNYVGLTAHWIDSNFVMHSLPLGIVLHQGRTTAPSLIKKFYEDIDRELGDKANVFALTTDTTSNMNAYVARTEEYFSSILY